MGEAWPVLIVFLGATVGIPMGIAFSGPLYLIPIIGAGILAIFGLIKHEKLYGQICAIIGIVVWCVLGCLGLGTGT